MAQTCFCRRGGLGPISLPLFQGIRFGTAVAEFGSRAWSHSSVAHGGRPCPIGTHVGFCGRYRGDCVAKLVCFLQLVRI